MASEVSSRYIIIRECQLKFHFVSENEVRKVILSMNEKKANLTGDISA